MLLKRTFTSRRMLAVAAAGLLAAGLGACSSSTSSPGTTSNTGAASSPSSSSSATTSTSGSSQTLVMESSPENSITQDFNPFVSTAAPQGMGATGLIYEPLIQFDLAKPSINYPWLATGYKWSNGGKSITFTIRQGVKWNNGTPMTPADVVFTYDLLKKNASINLGGLTMSSVTASGNDVTITFPTSQYMNLQQIAGVAILPQAIWSKVGNPATFTDPTPVGTGPYTLSQFTSAGFTLAANPNYWKQKVAVSKVYFPVYTSNTGALTALFSGQIDWTGNYIPGLQKNFVNTNPAYHHFWEAAGGTNSLMPNLNKWPTNQLAVRQAISAAIDRTTIGSEGEAGLESPVLNATGLTLPTFAAWSAPVASLTNKATADAATAAKILTSAGYTKGSDGFFQKGGQKVSLTIVDPSSYTDYAQDDALVAQQLKAAGIDATFQGLSVNAWNAAVASGDFQLTMHWSNGGITPYNMYQGWLDSSLSTGSSATGDYERLKEPAMDAALQKLSGDQSIADQTKDLVPLEKYVAENLPVIPTTTAAEWFEYNSQHFVGWPTQDNPYDSGQPSGTNNGPGTGSDEVVILHLTPR
jgi:peptide/nickel transport system substrate-binding protein